VDYRKRYRIAPGKSARLADRDPGETPGSPGKEAAERVLEKNRERLRELQLALFAEDTRALLVVLQAMDTGGKDGVIRGVFTGFNPQGCRVTAFKVPNAEEASHDFLWRIHRALPPRGEIGIFNRSHYEDVVVVRVKDLVEKSVWSARYDRINRFEKDLRDEGTHVVKLFLHIDKDEQKERLQARLDDPDRRWKFSLGDLEERKRWSRYAEAYEDAITRCSTKHAPWYVVPANKKWFRNLVVSSILLDHLEEMNPRFPRTPLDPRKIRIV
jgi:PPK2 family polyphosphate:nucleotide phosphotransferase